MVKFVYPLISKTMKETQSSLPVQTKEVSSFLEEIAIVCRKHGMSISHEDKHGSFEIKNYNRDELNWLFEASNKITEPLIRKLHNSGISGAFADKDKTLEK